MHALISFSIQVLLLFFVYPLSSQGQDAAASGPTSSIKASSGVIRYPLQIGTGATTVIIFPAPICDDCIDHGHPAIATRTVGGASNVLRVKSSRKDFPASNLTVVTTDGNVYSFMVSYTDQPSTIPIDFSTLSAKGPALLTPGRMNNAEVGEACQIVAATAPRRSRPVARSVGQMSLRLQNILLRDGVMFFSLSLRNGSAITYDVDFVRCYVRDRARKRRTSAMEKMVVPLTQLLRPDSSVGAHNSSTLVVALPKFTIADSKYFCVEIFEKGGDRLLQLRFKGKHLLKAKAF